jgi:hypothetical protein
MAEERFAEFVARERERLHGEREAVLVSQRELEAKLAGIDRELSALDAYEATKSGKPALTQPRARAPRARRHGRREKVLEVIRQHPDGLARKDILERMGLRGDKSAEMAVSNALTALAKANQIRRGEDRKYMPV